MEQLSNGNEHIDPTARAADSLGPILVETEMIFQPEVTTVGTIGERTLGPDGLFVETTKPTFHSEINPT